jgi:hypothetical protein
MTVSALRVLLFAFAGLGATLVQAQAPAPPMPNGANVLLGRVVEVGTDASVGGAMVTLIGHFDASGKPATPNPITREMPPNLNVMTTAEGHFVFRNLPAGLFTITTRAFGYVSHDFPPMVVEVRDSPKPTELQLRVWKYAAIGGRVVDERGEPVTGIPAPACSCGASQPR